MSHAPGWTPTLRYSPVNGMIVDWGHGGNPFALCGMPQPACELPVHAADAPGCDPCSTPVIEAVDTYDWYRWVPEIIAGLPEASEDMAATYARRAAIEFCAKTRCLQRLVPIELQHGVLRYPIEHFDEERAKGVTAVDSAKGPCAHEGCHRGAPVGVPSVHSSSQEIRFACQPPADTGHVLVTVYVAPTEDSCAHDALLWDDYRAEITKGARAAFIDEAYSFGAYKSTRGNANFRGDSFMVQRAMQLRQQFEKDMLRIKAEVSTNGDVRDLRAPIALFTRYPQGGRR